MTDAKNIPPKEKLKEILTDEQYRVTQEKSTEEPFSGAYVHTQDEGMYKCVVCGEPLFDSDSKFDSGTGWPSFDKPHTGEALAETQDDSFFMKRTEVVCKSCGAHLGHVFDDGPKETTGKRYCINSCSLSFEKDKSGEDKSSHYDKPAAD